MSFFSELDGVEFTGDAEDFSLLIGAACVEKSASGFVCSELVSSTSFLFAEISRKAYF